MATVGSHGRDNDRIRVGSTRNPQDSSTRNSLCPPPFVGVQDPQGAVIPLLLAPSYILTTILSLVGFRVSNCRPDGCFDLALPLTVGKISLQYQDWASILSLFLMLGGLFGSYKSRSLQWISSTFPRPRAKRAAAYAIINSLGNIAQIWSPYLYPKTDGPRYTIAFATNSVMAGTAVIFCIVLRFFLKRANDHMDREEAEGGVDEKDRVRYVL